jgi:hypothetical protein
MSSTTRGELLPRGAGSLLKAPPWTREASAKLFIGPIGPIKIIRVLYGFNKSNKSLTYFWKSVNLRGGLNFKMNEE